MERISVRVDERLKKELEAEAREKGVRPSDIVREALEKHVRRRAPTAEQQFAVRCRTWNWPDRRN